MEFGIRIIQMQKYKKDNKGINSTVKAIIFIFLAIICAMVIHIYNKRLVVDNYGIQTNNNVDIRILQLTDLHNAQFGKHNSKLIEKVRQQHPDIIVMTGDMLNRENERTDIVTNLITALVDIAPVYYGLGNHEYAFMNSFDKDLIKILTDAGAIVVDNDYVDVDINGNQLRIGGYMGYYRIPGMTVTSEDEKNKQLKFFDDFENTNRYKILINHIPTTWLDWGYNDYPVDLVFSGHYHGGQIVLPFIGPLFAPYIGFNPPYAKGVYKWKYATCILSAGLGDEYAYIPRINNPPEIVGVDLKPTTE